MEPPLPQPTRLPPPPPPPPRPVYQTYTVRRGDTLSGIAYRFGASISTLQAWNGLRNVNAIYVGQRLRVGVTATEPQPWPIYGPATPLIPDSELVYGPSSVGFDVTAFANSRPGYLKNYGEVVEERIWLSGPQIVQLVAQRYSVSPRLLLAFLEYYGGWLNRPYPVGETQDLFHQLSQLANQLNMGYYGVKYSGLRTVNLKNGWQAILADGLNPGSAAVQYVLARGNDYDGWVREAGEGGMITAYHGLFGDAFQYYYDLHAGLSQPELQLPWADGETWYYTGGPHGGWDSGSAYAAVDFVGDPKPIGCAVSNAWVRAAAPGLVIRSDHGEVLVDMDGDGAEQTGWVLFYMHMADEGRVWTGAQVNTGDPIGHPSCLGGFSTGAHLHFARRYNGEWIPVDGGPAPLVLSGWTFQSQAREYQGSMAKDGQTLRPCGCREGNVVKK